MRRKRSAHPPDAWMRRKLPRTARRLSVVLLVAGVLAALAAADRAGWFGQAPQSDVGRYHEQTFRVVHVVDGDTIDIDQPDSLLGKPRTRIRLWGVDTPETCKPNHPIEHFGPEASRFTRKLTANQMIRLELLPNSTRDKYDRLLAYIYLPDGTMLNRRLIVEGFAYADPRFKHPYRQEFTGLMQTARQNRIGLWENLNPEQLPYYLRRK